MKPDAPVMDSRLRGNDELGYERGMKREARTTPYDSADYLDSEEAIVAYLKIAFGEGDADDIRAAVGAVARALGVKLSVSA